MSQKITLNSLPVKLIILFSLLIFSAIPRMYVDGLIQDRQNFEAQAISSVVSGWASRHSWGLARLVIPYTYTEKASDGKISTRYDKIGLDPVSVKMDVTDQIEYRERGIFKFPIYRADLKMTGSFAIPKDLDSSLTDEVIRPGNQTLLFESATSGSVAEFHLKLNGKEYPIKRTSEGLRLELTEHNFRPGETVVFELDLQLNGYEGIDFRSQTDQLEVNLKSQWPHPSFRGQLPRAQSISAQGFEAQWKIMQPSMLQNLSVDYIEPVNIYSQSDRALKYGFLITLLCLSVLFLTETLWGLKIHAMQYLLFTFPLASFYVLLIAFAEHMGFMPAYGIASFAVIGLLFLYLNGISNSRKQSFGIAGMLAFVYGLILTMLSSEDYALLIGAICMFTCLASFMLLTRKLNWSRALPLEKVTHEQKS